MNTRKNKMIGRLNPFSLETDIISLGCQLMGSHMTSLNKSGLYIINDVMWRHLMSQIRQKYYVPFLKIMATYKWVFIGGSLHLAVPKRQQQKISDPSKIYWSKYKKLQPSRFYRSQNSQCAQDKLLILFIRIPHLYGLFNIEI